MRRLLDLTVAAALLLLTAPLLALAALAVRVASPGPALYRARRLGRDGRPFTMYKLRTMRAAGAAGPPITGTRDPRVFPLGALLRRSKIDELPQLVNVLRGEMALVGPRPEDPALARRHYAPEHYETLRVAPGLTSPGSLYQVTHGDALLDGDDPVRAYARRLLPVKLALDLAYVRRASWTYDLAILARTARTLAAVLLGRRAFPDPPELAEARRIAAAVAAPARRRPIAREVAAMLAPVLLLLLACATEPGGPDMRWNGPVARMVGAGDIASCAHDRDAPCHDPPDASGAGSPGRDA